MDKQELEMMVEGVIEQLPEDFVEYMEKQKARRAIEQLAPQQMPKTLAEWYAQYGRFDDIR